MEITIKDVAKEAGVAISTVSKYMSGGSVRQENEVRIREAVKKLGYSPNSLARGLKRSKTFTVGLMIEAMDGPYWAKLINYLEAELQKMGYALILCCHGKSVELAREYAEYLTSQMVDGIFFAPIQEEEDYMNVPREKEIPLIALEAAKGFEVYGLVQTNYTAMAYELVENLIIKGHEKIAVIGGAPSLRSVQECMRGYMHVMEDYDIEVCREWMLYGENTRESGLEMMYRLWQAEKKPTAVFAANYYMAMGVLRAASELHIVVPDELSLAVIDDYVFSTLVPVKVTAATQPLEKISHEACRLFRESLEHPKQKRTEKVRIKGEIVPRESIAPPRDEEEE
ncbi:LacI family DNA-binding transcriptional regulator [Murimonas intestini]|uniref:LacI family DNA-binding transcriptional regulator n=1 Tax=Murimonas intestini TaxID=1337051 RepID=UPI0011DDD107|nr:LacI family DNA-binding transcriptional regulator [Murimonas intestini]